MKTVVFDLGGTLMEYTGMPLSWTDYYPKGFLRIAAGLSLSPSEENMENAVQRLMEFNPRLHYREAEYTPEFIFRSCLASWGTEIRSYSEVAELFFQGMHLEARIFPDALPCLSALRKKGYFLACLTDLPTAMPDAVFRRDISPLLERIDLYLSSELCGYRKPNPAGLERIARQAGTPLEELVFVGDEEKDCETAKRAGCRFLKISRKSAQDKELSTLELLPTLLP